MRIASAEIAEMQRRKWREALQPYVEEKTDSTESEAALGAATAATNATATRDATAALNHPTTAASAAHPTVALPKRAGAAAPPSKARWGLLKRALCKRSSAAADSSESISSALPSSTSVRRYGE